MVDFLNQDKVSDFSSFDENHAPANYLFKRQDNAVQYLNLVFDTSTGVPAVHECVTISKDLHVSLAYNGFPIPLPEWFRSRHSCTIAVGSASIKYKIFSGQVLLMAFHMGTSNQKHFFEFEQFSRFAGKKYCDFLQHIA